MEYSEDPLPSFLVDTLFPTVCDYIVSTYDLLFIRFKGIELIRTYLPFVSTEKIRYKDRKERYGAHYILRVIVHALNHKVCTQHKAVFWGFPRQGIHTTFFY